LFEIVTLIELDGLIDLILHCIQLLAERVMLHLQTHLPHFLHLDLIKLQLVLLLLLQLLQLILLLRDLLLPFLLLQFLHFLLLHPFQLVHFDALLNTRHVNILNLNH